MDAPNSMLVLGHDGDLDTVLVQAGTLGSWAADRGVGVIPGSMTTTASAADLPDPAAVDAVAVLGSVEGAWDDSVPWLAAELAYVRAAIDAATPVLGMCFGGQLLARVLGGTAEPADGRHENGWRTISSEVPEVISPGPWMEFHFDTFSAPPGAVVLARTENGDQMFRSGVHVGTQFHPEITPAGFETWVARWTGTALEARFVDLGITTEGLRAETAEHAEASRVASWRLFDDFARGGGLVSTAAVVPSGAAP